MDSSILLLCKYGSLTLVVKVVKGFKFEDLVASICKKWNNLVSRRLHLLYVVSEHSNCLLENDDDFDSMVALAVAYGVSCVEVSVNEAGSFSRVDHSSSSTLQIVQIGECSTLQIHEDPLEKFCPHHETKRLSADWAYLISHVGQEFRGGVEDFRICLCKYAIELGFKFNYLKNDKIRVTAVCSKKIYGCKWFVHATLDKSNGFFALRS